MKNEETIRCFGGPDDPMMMRYHDEEWGVQVHDDRLLFEILTLEGNQAGLSWQTILGKRENYRKAFNNFNPEKIAVYGEADEQRLLSNTGIVRNRVKIHSIINNARRFIEIQKKYGSFDLYIWEFSGNQMFRRFGALTLGQLPTKTTESEAMSVDLKKHGFRFVGPIICYAFMQAVGMINDHLTNCFKAPKR